MAEGFKALTVNTQERAISSDINRLQKFAHKDVAELFRFMLDVFRSDDNTIGTVTAPNTVETPLRAEIIEGLLCKPQIASTDVFVDPGAVFLMAPDAALDESDYKFVNDVGVSTPGALTIAANVSGFIRIDVVECRMNPVDLTATESRDVFDPTTGLFTAAVVTKERQGRLEYRVRQGTPALGMPANQLGWLPLMVASVPNASVSNDTVTFWDVRPLIAQRAFGVSNFTRDEAIFLGGRSMSTGVGTGAAAQATQVGEVDLVDFNGRRLGGRLRSSAPGAAEADSFDWQATVNYDTGALPATNTTNFAYLVTPFGLPCWARYAAAPAARLPRSPRGLLILTTTGPDARGRPSAALALPPSTGLGGTTSDGYCWATTRRTGGGSGTARAVVIADRRQMLLGNATAFQVAGVVGVGFATFVPVANVQFPQHAKGIWIQIEITKSVANGTTQEISSATLDWYYQGLNTNTKTRTYPPSQSFINTTGGPIATIYNTGAIFIPLPTEYPATTLTSPMQLLMLWAGAFPLNPDTAILSVIGWEL